MRWRTAISRFWRRGLVTLVCAALGVLALDRLFPPPLDEVRTSTVVTDREGEWLHGFAVRDESGEARWRLAVSLEEVDPLFVERLIAIEDKRFWSHPGIDPLAVLRASRSALTRGRIVSGASTITMQTARLLEPRPRNLGSKLVEMLRAFQLEARLSKEEILELYLTLAPYGGNLEGVRAASLAWFGKEPGQLTDAQQALLIALPQSPEARRPDRRPQTAKASRKVILSKLVLAGQLDERRANEAAEAILPVRRQPFPRLAWHVAHEHHRLRPDGGNISLTLEADLQQEVERLSGVKAKGLPDKANIAVLIVENESHAVRAATGSAGLSLPGGWIDMTRALRSPGSTLKPFIYGLAFDDGVASSRTLIDDAPYSFDGYKPENFSRAFHGDVTVGEALQHSLNVPAVLALDQIGPARFAASLNASGVTASMPGAGDNRQSLAIALGGLGLTARDLAMLYTGLANGGEILPLRWQEDEQDTDETYQLLSAASASRLTRIMQEAPAPAGRAPAALSSTAPKVAFKTGTSYGYRDAWAAGYTEDYTVIVWVGHPNGAPRPGVTGREAALPLMFDLFDLLADRTLGHELRDINPAREGFEAGGALARLAPGKGAQPPEIVFPEDGVSLFMAAPEKARGFALAARGGAGAYRWYVDGRPVPLSARERAIWRPDHPGFYEVTVVDRAGRKSVARISVLSAG